MICKSEAYAGRPLRINEMLSAKGRSHSSFIQKEATGHHFLLMQKRHSEQQQKAVECNEGTEHGCTNRKKECLPRVGYDRDR